MRRLIEKFMAPAAFLGLALAVTVLGFTLASGYSPIGLIRSLVESTIAADGPAGQENPATSSGQSTGETPRSSPALSGEDVGTDSEHPSTRPPEAAGPSSPAAPTYTPGPQLSSTPTPGPLPTVPVPTLPIPLPPLPTLPPTPALPTLPPIPTLPPAPALPPLP